MLKYLFTATFADGSTIEQTPEDVSARDPIRSCFFDVLETGRERGLVAFVLRGDGHEYGVDLRDGHFEIDGVKFFMHEKPEAGYELIFFRQHTHSFNLNQEEIAHEVVYRMGWKVAGDQQTQRVMQFE